MFPLSYMVQCDRMDGILGGCVHVFSVLRFHGTVLHGTVGQDGQVESGVAVFRLAYMGFHRTVPLSYMVQRDKMDRWDLGWLCSVYIRSLYDNPIP